MGLYASAYPYIPVHLGYKNTLNLDGALEKMEVLKEVN